MITGFNTDIEHQGVTYHVQTEDKGVATPLILSLVYDRGTILASKRSPYNDLLLPTFDEKALAERLQNQHKIICAAVRAGRIDDLRRMTMKESASRQKELAARKELAKKELAAQEELSARQKAKTPVESSQSESPRRQSPASVKPKTENITPPQILKDEIQPVGRAAEIELDLPKIIAERKIEARSPKPKDDFVWDFPVDTAVDEPIIEAVQIIEDEIILPDEAVRIVGDFEENARAAPGKLEIELPEGMTFKSGEQKTVNVLVRRAGSEKGLSAAQITLKVLGATFRPLIFQAKTDANGIATINLQLPNFRSGRAAVLVKARSGGEEVELRRVIRQG